MNRLTEEDKTKVLTGWRRFLPGYIYLTRSSWKVLIFPKQLTVWILVFCGGAYLGAGTALYINDRYRHKLENISWFDRIYPPNWDIYRQTRGDSYIHQAQKSLELGEFPKAFHQVRAGIARSPQNREGRILLVEMLQAIGSTDLAEKTLTEGLKFHANHPGYLGQTIQTLFRRQKDSDLIRISSELLQRDSLSLAAAQRLRLAKAQAQFFRGNFDQSEDTLADTSISRLPESRLLRARIEWERGFPELALALIAQLEKEFPANLEIYRQKVQWLIAEGQTDKARGSSLIRRIRHPDQFQPRIDLLYAFDQRKDENAVAEETQFLLRDFKSDYAAILQLGDFAANTGREEIAQLVWEHAAQHEMPIEGPALMLVESLITAAQYDLALEETKELLDQHPAWEQKLAPVFNGLQAICYHALGDREEANLFLNNYLNLETVRAENLVAVSKRLQSVGADREARFVLDHAVKRDRLNQAALNRLIEFDLEAADAPELPVNLSRIMEMRRPPSSLLRKAYDKLGQDRYLFVENRNQLMDQLLAKLTG